MAGGNQKKKEAIIRKEIEQVGDHLTRLKMMLILLKKTRLKMMLICS